MGNDVISEYNALVFWLLLLTTLWLLFTLVSKRGTLTRQRRNILVGWAGAQTLWEQNLSS
jgi:hypothetical protein